MTEDIVRRNGGAGNCPPVFVWVHHVARDLDRAQTLLSASCEASIGNGCVQLGLMHENSVGMAQNPARAARLYERGCDLDDESCTPLGLAYAKGAGVARDMQRAVTLFERACEDDSALGCAALATAYETGGGVSQDGARAASFFQRACDEGAAQACEKIGAQRRQAV